MPAVHFWGAGQYGCSTEEKKKALEKLNVFKGFLERMTDFDTIGGQCAGVFKNKRLLQFDRRKSTASE